MIGGVNMKDFLIGFLITLFILVGCIVIIDLCDGPTTTTTVVGEEIYDTIKLPKGERYVDLAGNTGVPQVVVEYAPEKAPKTYIVRRFNATRNEPLMIIEQ